jgi:hypothetical protein
MAKNNNKQKPPNTLLSSQTTHPFDRQPCHCTPVCDTGQTAGHAAVSTSLLARFRRRD